MGKLLRAVFVIVLIAAVVVLGLGYVGLVPAVANVLGVQKPRDLGVRYTDADLASGNVKSGTKTTLLPAGASPEESYKVTGSIPVKAAFSYRELTALAAERERQWEYCPVSSVQIKIHDDGTVEASGILRMDRVYNCAAAVGLPMEAVDAALSTFQIARGNPPVYVKGTGAVTNGKVTLDLQRLEVGRLPIPASLIAQNEGLIAAAIEQVIKASGVNARSVTFAGGELRFDGTKPEMRALSPAR